MRGLHGQMPQNSELIYFTRFFPEGQEGSAFSFTILFHHSLSPFSFAILFPFFRRKAPPLLRSGGNPGRMAETKGMRKGRGWMAGSKPWRPSSSAGTGGSCRCTVSPVEEYPGGPCFDPAYPRQKVLELKDFRSFPLHFSDLIGEHSFAAYIVVDPLLPFPKIYDKILPATQ